MKKWIHIFIFKNHYQACFITVILGVLSLTFSVSASAFLSGLESVGWVWNAGPRLISESLFVVPEPD
ncbi:hypothetical protein, partial [Endozoicomonas arenosclerae]|uniref:hypothetical protein n=1 Tax=Endozoicomonas arenosclerae TaxID=1633495 RepID=UPI001C12B265